MVRCVLRLWRDPAILRTPACAGDAAPDAHSEDLPRQKRAIAEGVKMEKDPAEQEMLARGIGNELTEIFVGYVRGEYDFAEASFAAYDVLEDLHAIATGDYELDEDGDIDDEYDVDEATETQEDLAQEPAR
jgi:hypothetical protein